MANAKRRGTPSTRNPGASSSRTSKDPAPGAAEQAETSRPRRKKRVVIPLVILVLAAIAFALYWFVTSRGYVSTDDAFIDGHQITISSKMLGRIAELTVDEGDTVAQRRLLVQLDDSDLRAQEAQAKANLEYVQRTVSLAKVGRERAQDDFNRAAIQFKSNVISNEQYDHARKALDMAEAQYAVALAQVNTAKAQVDVVETQLENSRILAPTDGTVAKKWAMPGEVVQPGQPIFTLYDLQNVWIEANFEETKLASIELDAPVELTVDAYSGRKFEGRVMNIGAATASQFSLIPPNNASGNFTKVTQRVPVKISIEQASLGEDRVLLLPGMSVTVRIRVSGD